MIKRYFRYKDNRYEISDDGLIKLMDEIDIQDIKAIFELDDTIPSIRHNNIMDIISYAKYRYTEHAKRFGTIAVNVCDICGEEHETMYEIAHSNRSYNMHHVCKQCIEREHLEYCLGCGGYAPANHFKEVSVYDYRTNEKIQTIRICSQCVGDDTNIGRIFTCRNCREHYMFGILHSDGTIGYRCAGEYNGYYVMCGHCQQDHVYCSHCERIYPRATTTLVNGRCENCHIREAKQKALKSYGYKPEPDFKKDEDEPSTSKDHIGIEWETEIDNSFDVDTYDIAFDGTEKNEDFLYAKTDSSLNNGVEFVSHPITFKAWKNTYLERLEKDTIQRIKQYLIDKPSTAGIHLHFNRKALGTNEEKRRQVINRICYLLSKKTNYEWLTKFCRRDRYKIERWARAYCIEDYADDMSQDIPIKDLINTNGDRYHVVNLRNTNTIEFRCFASSTDIKDIQAYMVFVHNVVEFCKKNDDKTVRTTHLKDVCTYYYKRFMTDYLKERGLI